LLFSDVNNSFIYFDAISYLSENNIINGYPDGTFKPGNTINRAEFMKIVIGATDTNIYGDNCFPDVKNEWFASYICTGLKSNVINGYPDGTFRPELEINVVEALKMTFNAFDIEVDSVDNSVWYMPYVNYAKNNGYFLDSFYDYSKNITREEVSELVYRIYNKLY